jgi:predicted HTH transcriptional regulator
MNKFLATQTRSIRNPLTGRFTQVVKGNIYSKAYIKPWLKNGVAPDFLVEFRKDIYNDEYFTGLGLNERQIKAVLYVKEKGKITNSDYQEINEIAERTASRDLADLVSKKILINSGLKGAGAFYTLTNSITP